MAEDNPYSSPVADSEAAISSVPESESLATIARATFLAWEKLRLIYIAILAAITLLLSAFDFTLLGTIRFWMLVIEGAIVANVCYFAGPIIETYVRWLGFRAPWLRVSLFVLGTMVASALVFAAMVVDLLPSIN